MTDDNMAYDATLDKPVTVAQTDKPRRSYRKGGTGYAGKVEIDGHAIYYKSLESGVFQRLFAIDKDFQEEMKRIQRESKPVTIPGNGKSVPGKLSDREAESQSMAILEDRQAKIAGVLVDVLYDWELPEDDGTKMEFTPDNIRGLPFEVMAEIAELMQQKSSVGRTKADFLADS